MKPVRRIRSRTVVMPVKDVDTDQIMPARFLTTTTREGLGDKAFYDLRFRDDGTPNEDFVLNRPEAEGCSILVADRNFGCGSSREHAPWGLLDYGFEAVISNEIADIFRNNSLKNGLLAIVIDDTTHKHLLDNPGTELDIDVEASTITLPGDNRVNFVLDDFARYCLLNGLDQLGYLQQHGTAITQFEETRSWKP